MENIEIFEDLDSIDPIDTIQVIGYAILTTVFAECSFLKINKCI